ncbi:uncharacterized protein LOC115245731, partial [Formica exsecta]|uniref:uncharacterized protein LOC115245731 n=1 Tax=Formica exsecta TaxID=72781 RepID=UPI001144232A
MAYNNITQKEATALMQGIDPDPGPGVDQGWTRPPHGWNCRSLTRRMPELIHLLDTYSIDIAALCETRLDDVFLPSISNYDIFTNNRNRHGGGVAILIGKQLRFSYIRDTRIGNICSTNNIELLMGKVWLESNKHLYICSLYSPPRGGSHPFTNNQAWTEILQFCDSFDPIIICGDFNGKSTLWSNLIPGPDTEGRKLETAISSTNLICINNGNLTWTSADLSSASSLDITLVSPSVATKCSWQILDSNYGSDHYPIVTKINDTTYTPEFGRPSYIISKIDWTSFQEECNIFVHSFQINMNNLNSTYEELIYNIHKALERAGAKRSQANKHRRKAPAPCQRVIDEEEFHAAFNKLAPHTPVPPLSTSDLGALSDLPFTASCDAAFMQKNFSIYEFNAAVSSLKTKSAPGPDLISNKIIKKLPENLHKLILKIFNCFFNKGSYPSQWNNYFTVFIPKPGGKKALRPISLANNLHKIFEKLILKRLEWWAENNKVLSQHQFGFRRGLSCMDNVATLITDIHLANRHRKFTGVVFLDLVGAFDNVLPEALLILLEKFGLPQKIISFIRKTTTNRNLTGYAAGIPLQTRSTDRGLPQGSILSPTLFNIYVQLLSAADGKCKAQFTVAEEHLNSIGSMHGGFTSSIIDIVSSYALTTYNNKPLAVSVDLHVT